MTGCSVCRVEMTRRYSNMCTNYIDVMSLFHFRTCTSQIYLQDVCFWDYPTPLYVKEMCEEKLYPPRFTIHIRGVARQNDVIRAEFTFPGAVAFPGREEPVAIIHFPLPVQRSTRSTGTMLNMCISLFHSHYCTV